MAYLFDDDKSKLDFGTAVLEKVYPVGSIYMSVNSANPGTLFGGTWQKLEGRFLLGASSGYAAGSTGGEATHILTVNEMPSHKHSNNGSLFSNTSSGLIGGSGSYNVITDWTYDLIPDTGNTGGGQAHNNMPPYLAVYMWKRTA